MTLLVQGYLRSGGTPETLFAEHGVRVREHNGKASVTYDMLVANREDPLASQCRGLILRPGTWDIVAYPFDRFFNHDEFCAHEIDWATAAYEQKLDGTLLIVYWDDADSRWRCGTRNMCEAQLGPLGYVAFAEQADDAARVFGAESLNDLMTRSGVSRDNTYMFELTGPMNRVVCHYDAVSLHLLGVRSLMTLFEIDPVPHADLLGVPVPERWKFSNLSDMLEVLREWHPREYEGVVVRDACFRRVKVKSPKYLAAHHATDSLGASWRSVTEAVIAGHTDDIIGLLPDYVAKRVISVQGAIADLVARTVSEYATIQPIDDMKAFAFAAQKLQWPAAMFALKRGHAETPEDVVKRARPNHMLEMLQKLRPGAFVDDVQAAQGER